MMSTSDYVLLHGDPLRGNSLDRNGTTACANNSEDWPIENSDELPPAPAGTHNPLHEPSPRRRLHPRPSPHRPRRGRPHPPPRPRGRFGRVRLLHLPARGRERSVTQADPAYHHHLPRRRCRPPSTRGGALHHRRVGRTQGWRLACTPSTASTPRPTSGARMRCQWWSRRSPSLTARRSPARQNGSFSILRPP
ncbi:hypothetical protein PVAP13_7KG323366 [Panicum virgatum]|uniref:Uncharacterized protein n=1 Tax=Panicum virgatum TaxID=38727 RepID=A0A8T0QL26_PANVG|nr:hypothetical protein PVAP13_7KG323366 [Panicum virgatum]